MGRQQQKREKKERERTGTSQRASGGLMDIDDEGKVVKEILIEGQGTVKPNSTATVLIEYIGYLEDGTVFAYNPQYQCRLGMGGVIKGWDIAIPSMLLAEKVRVKCHSDYGYGAKGNISRRKTREVEAERETGDDNNKNNNMSDDNDDDNDDGNDDDKNNDGTNDTNEDSGDSTHGLRERKTRKENQTTHVDAEETKKKPRTSSTQHGRPGSLARPQVTDTRELERMRPVLYKVDIPPNATLYFEMRLLSFLNHGFFNNITVGHIVLFLFILYKLIEAIIIESQKQPEDGSVLDWRDVKLV